MVIDEMPFDALAFDETTFHDKASYEVAFKILPAILKTNGRENCCWKNGILRNLC